MKPRWDEEDTKLSTLAELKAEATVCKKKHSRLIISGQFVEYLHTRGGGKGHEWYLSREESTFLENMMRGGIEGI
jgi:hypothetical protein